jgi:hypothetical protein
MRLNRLLATFIIICFLASLSSFDSLALVGDIDEQSVDMMLGCVSKTNELTTKISLFVLSLQVLYVNQIPCFCC